MGEIGGRNLLKIETTFKNPSYYRVNTVFLHKANNQLIPK